LAFVFPGLSGRGKERGSSEAGWGGNLSCGRNAIPQLVEVTKGCGERERERGGNLRTRVEVSRGIPWIYPRERVRRKVERKGEPKQRCR
jgi:hypothetical protein